MGWPKESGTGGGCIVAAVVRAFGETILKPSGELDRKALGALVFSDDAKRGDAKWNDAKWNDAKWDDATSKSDDAKWDGDPWYQ